MTGQGTANNASSESRCASTTWKPMSCICSASHPEPTSVSIRSSVSLCLESRIPMMDEPSLHSKTALYILKSDLLVSYSIDGCTSVRCADIMACKQLERRRAKHTRTNNGQPWSTGPLGQTVIPQQHGRVTPFHQSQQGV